MSKKIRYIKDKAKKKAAKEKAKIERAWKKFKAWKGKHQNEILINSAGEEYAPRNKAEFKEQWTSSDSDNILSDIIYYSVYKTEEKVARAMRKKLKEQGKEAPNLEAIKKMGVYEFRREYLDDAIKEFADLRLIEKRREYILSHPDTVIMIDGQKITYADLTDSERERIINASYFTEDLRFKREIGQEVTIEFFGGS